MAADGNDKKKKKKFSVVSLLSNIVTVILVLLVLLLIFLNVARKGEDELVVHGYSMFNILTASMSPKIIPGDLVIVKAVAKTNIQENDIITYTAAGERYRVTHRVVQVLNGGDAFITKGDAVANPDRDAVKYEKVVGKVIFKIPFVGSLVNLFANKTLWIWVPLIFIALIIALEAVKGSKKPAALKDENAPAGASPEQPGGGGEDFSESGVLGLSPQGGDEPEEENNET